MKRPTVTSAAGANPYHKVLVHGPSGAGKTRFAASFPNPLVFDIEGGTASAKEFLGEDNVVPANKITVPDLLEYIDWAATKEASQYETVVLDSLTHLQNIFLTAALKDDANKDPRQAYGQLQQYYRQLLEKLHRLNKHTVIVTRSKTGEDIEGAEKLFPELSPSAFGVIPALVDYAVVVTTKQTGIGRLATSSPVLYTSHPKYWTKTRELLPAELVPNFAAFDAALKEAKK